MTEYGRGPGSQPWHPDDPLYGDQGWGGQQAGAGHDPYGQDPLGQQPYAQDPYGGQQYPEQYPQAQDYQQYPQHGQQPYPQQQWQGQGHEPGYPQQPQAQGQHTGGWDPGYGAVDPTDPYARPADPHTGEYPDHYAAPGAYPPPEPHYARQQQAQHEQQPGYAQEPMTAGAGAAAPSAPVETGGGPAKPEQSEQDDRIGAFLADDGEDDGPEEPGRGRGRAGKKPKRRSGLACLFTAVVLVGVVGGGGYYGYQFWQSRFGEPADYAGEGTGQVTVEIPAGAGGAEIGGILKDAGVVKSSGAFVKAVEDSGKVIQPGSYTLRKEMSGAAAVAMLTDASANGLTVTEGMRNAVVYAAIDKKIGLKAGTTADIAKREAKNLGLPDWANDNSKIKDPLEGFLYPARYSVGKGAKPEAVLRQMVKTANAKYADYDLKGEAKKLGLDSPLQVITVASLVQAEGVTHDEYRKMAEVVYNRLKPDNPETYGKLQFDSTYNYIKNQSKTDIGLDEIKKYDNPYNTYFYKGLPPGPIGNPGEKALKAVLNPTHDGWFYFLSLDNKTTQFTKTYADFQKLYNEYNDSKKKG
ncbi:endolytic transglycosylase MltG [Streptomyces sp. P1-3]|uniref:endolytic transglycosylase MltG n=1 Tax=Streptomyces sp. P1-3 TaxID=3421658 RepID=UPI003D36A880